MHQIRARFEQKEYERVKGLLWTEKANVEKDVFFAGNWCPQPPADHEILARIQNVLYIEFLPPPQPGILRNAGCQVKLNHRGEVVQVNSEGAWFEVHQGVMRENYDTTPWERKAILCRLARKLEAEFCLEEEVSV